jgi:hypothetical protein
MSPRVLVSLATTEACTACEEIFDEAEQRAFDPADNDHCPRCGERGTLTTYYGEPEARITEWQLGDHDEVFVEDLALADALADAVEDGDEIRIHVALTAYNQARGRWG